MVYFLISSLFLYSSRTRNSFYYKIPFKNRLIIEILLVKEVMINIKNREYEFYEIGSLVVSSANFTQTK